MTNQLTTRQPIACPAPREGIRALVGKARRYRSPMGGRRADGFGRGVVIPNGILLKEGET